MLAKNVGITSRTAPAAVQLIWEVRRDE